MDKERNKVKNFSFKMDVEANPDITNLSSTEIILQNKKKKHITDIKLKEIDNKESFSSEDSYIENNNDIIDKKKKSNETINYVRFNSSDVNTRLASKVDYLNTANNREIISNTPQDKALYAKYKIKRKKFHNVFESPSNNDIISYHLKNKAQTTKNLISKPKVFNKLIGKYETKFKAKKVAYTRGSKLSNSNLINIMRVNNTKKFKEQKENNREGQNKFFTEKNVKYIDYISRSLNNEYIEFKDSRDNKETSSNSNDNLKAIVNNFINKLSVMTPKSNNMSLLKQLELVDQGTHSLLHKDIVNNFITSYNSNTNKLKELNHRNNRDNNIRYKNDNEYYINKPNNYDKLNTSIENMISPAQNYIQKTKIKIFSSKKEALWKLKPKHSNNKFNLKSSKQKNKKTKTNKTYTTITKNINKLDKKISKAYFSIVKKTNEAKNENFLGKKNNEKINTKNLNFSNNSKFGNIGLISKYSNNTRDSKYKEKYTNSISNNNNNVNKEQINLTSIMDMFSNNNSYNKINNTLNTYSNTNTTNNIDHANTCSHFFINNKNKSNQGYINDDNYSNNINMYNNNRFSTTYNRISSNQKQVGDKLKLTEIQRKKIQVNKDLSKVSKKIIKQNSLNSKAFKPLFKNYSKHACLSTSNYFNNSNNSFIQKSVSMNFNSPYNISKNESLNNTFNYNNSTGKQANNNLTYSNINSQSYNGNFLIKNHSLNLNSNTYNTISNAGNINISSFKYPTNNSNSMNNIKDNANYSNSNKRSSFIDSVNNASNNDSELLLKLNKTSLINSLIKSENRTRNLSPQSLLTNKSISATNKSINKKQKYNSSSYNVSNKNIIKISNKSIGINGKQIDSKNISRNNTSNILCNNNISNTNNNNRNSVNKPNKYYYSNMINNINFDNIFNKVVNISKRMSNASKIVKKKSNNNTNTAKSSESSSESKDSSINKDKKVIKRKKSNNSNACNDIEDNLERKQSLAVNHRLFTFLTNKTSKEDKEILKLSDPKEIGRFTKLDFDNIEKQEEYLRIRSLFFKIDYNSVNSVNNINNNIDNINSEGFSNDNIFSNTSSSLFYSKKKINRKDTNRLSTINSKNSRKDDKDDLIIIEKASSKSKALFSNYLSNFQLSERAKNANDAKSNFYYDSNNNNKFSNYEKDNKDDVFNEERDDEYKEDYEEDNSNKEDFDRNTSNNININTDINVNVNNQHANSDLTNNILVDANKNIIKYNIINSMHSIHSNNSYNSNISNNNPTETETEGNVTISDKFNTIYTTYLDLEDERYLRNKQLPIDLFSLVPLSLSKAKTIIDKWILSHNIKVITIKRLKEVKTNLELPSYIFLCEKNNLKFSITINMSSYSPLFNDTISNKKKRLNNNNFNNNNDNENWFNFNNNNNSNFIKIIENKSEKSSAYSNINSINSINNNRIKDSKDSKVNQTKNSRNIFNTISKMTANKISQNSKKHSNQELANPHKCNNHANSNNTNSKKPIINSRKRNSIISLLSDDRNSKKTVRFEYCETSYSHCLLYLYTGNYYLFYNLISSLIISLNYPCFQRPTIFKDSYLNQRK